MSRFDFEDLAAAGGIDAAGGALAGTVASADHEAADQSAWPALECREAIC